MNDTITQCELCQKASGNLYNLRIGLCRYVESKEHIQTISVGEDVVLCDDCVKVEKESGYMKLRNAAKLLQCSFGGKNEEVTN